MVSVINGNGNQPAVLAEPSPSGKLTVSAAGLSLMCGVGGSGVTLVTQVKALHRARFGESHPGTGFLGFDVMEEPPVVSVTAGHDGTQARAVGLEPGLEYVQIGEDCIPPRLSQEMAMRRDFRPDLRVLLERQPGRRYAKSLENGTRGERSYGELARRWSAAEIRSALRETLGRLNDLRLRRTDARMAAPSASLQIIVAASLAGGVGSAVTLPLVGEIKSTMNALGMDVSGATFVGLFFTPEAFPRTVLRLSNAFETLRDIALAQKEGVVP
ncbi:MAG: tubulin-like doman-containing protein [Bacillota bacterium]|nr:tubulin-like doman-containing protein [Bacillota bacterium]